MIKTLQIVVEWDTDKDAIRHEMKVDGVTSAVEAFGMLKMMTLEMENHVQAFNIGKPVEP